MDDLLKNNTELQIGGTRRRGRGGRENPNRINNITWDDKLKEWESGEVLKYPSRIKNKFLYEVIVVDDCSTDNSVDAAKTFLYRENYYITHTEKNSGPGIARNIGVDKSIGKYVLFLDSDDCLDSNILYKLYDTLVLNDFSPDLIAYNWKYLPNQKIFLKDIPT